MVDVDNRVPVINVETGQSGTLPADQINDAVFVDKKFQLAPVPSTSDLTKDGRVQVVDKDGVSGTLPVNEVHDAIKPEDQGGGGFQLKSQYERLQDPLVKHNIDLLKNNDTDTLSAFHQADDVLDDQHHFKMTNGSLDLSVPTDQLSQAKAAGFKFKDDNFQALVDAQVATNKNISYLDRLTKLDPNLISWKNAVNALSGNTAQRMINVTQASPESGNVFRSKLVALPEIEQQYPLESTGGTLGGIGLGFAAMSGPASKLGMAAQAAAEAGELSPLAAKAIGGATEALTYSLPDIAGQVIDHHPQEAAETFLLSTGLGALLHVGPSAINSALETRALRAGEQLPEVAGNMLSSAGLKDEMLAANEKTSFARALLDQSPKLDNTEQALKNLAAGDHLTPVLSKLGETDTFPLISKLESLGYKTGTSEAVDTALSKVLHSIEDASADGKITLSKLQQVNQQLIDSMNYRAIDELGAMKFAALDNISNTIKQASEAKLAQLVELGSPEVAKLSETWAQGKNIQEAAHALLSEFQGQVATGMAPELTKLGQAMKTMATHAGVGLQANIMNPGLALLSHIPGAKMLTGVNAPMGQATQRVIDSRGLWFDNIIKNHPNSWIVKNFNNPKIATFVALDAIAQNNARLNEIPSYLKALGEKLPASFMSNKDSIAQILGSESNGLSKDQQLQRLSDKVALLAANPAMAQARVNGLVQPLTHDHMQMAAVAQQSAQNTISYLHQLLNNGTQQVQAFQGPALSKKTRTTAEVNDIKNQLAAISNPYVLLAGLKDPAKLTPNMVKAVKATSPGVLQKMQQAINNQAYTGKVHLNYQQRLAASMIMEQPLDSTLQHVALLQQTYEPPQPASPMTPVKHSRTAHKLDMNKLPDHTTPAQRISST